jgi:hypothetical protein
MMMDATDLAVDAPTGIMSLLFKAIIQKILHSNTTACL